MAACGRVIPPRHSRSHHGTAPPSSRRYAARQTRHRSCLHLGGSTWGGRLHSMRKSAFQHASQPAATEGARGGNKGDLGRTSWNRGALT